VIDLIGNEKRERVCVCGERTMMGRMGEGKERCSDNNGNKVYGGIRI